MSTWWSNFFTKLTSPQTIKDVVGTVATVVATGAAPEAVAVAGVVAVVNDALLTPDNVEAVRAKLTAIRQATDDGLAMLADGVLSPDEVTQLKAEFAALTGKA